MILIDIYPFKKFSDVIYLILGNISNWHHNKSDAKIIIGYLPKIKAKTDFEKKYLSYQEIKRYIYQFSFNILTKKCLIVKIVE